MSALLPAAFRAPSLAMAKPVASVPKPEVLPGGCLYEPKWDGFRVAASVADTVTIWSRQGKDLTRYFPDLVAAFVEHVPPGCVIDGEALIWTGDRLDFTTLQARLTTGRRALPGFVRAHPASFAAFDILAAAGHDTRDLALKDRRVLLEELADGWAAPLNLSPITADYATALEWFEDFPPTGIEGLIIKGAGQRYEGGVRQWLKVKHRDNIDVVCAAVLGRRDAPSVLVAGLPLFGRLWIVGATSALGKSASKALALHLHTPRPDHPWPEEISPTTLDRFTSRKDPIRPTRVEPIVVEVSADVAWSGRRPTAGAPGRLRPSVAGWNNRPSAHMLDQGLRARRQPKDRHADTPTPAAAPRREGRRLHPPDVAVRPQVPADPGGDRTVRAGRG